MARKIIVSLVGDQTIPNLLFIKEKGFAEFYYFVSTDLMEKRNHTFNTVKSLKIDELAYKTLKVIEDSISDIDEKLDSQLEIDDDDEILINITGGTKIMALSVYNYFTRIGAGDIFYIPIGKNEIRQIFPLRKNRLTAIGQRVNLWEYLTAYGVKIQEKSFKNKNLLSKPEDQTKDLFIAFISNQRDGLFQAAENVRKLDKRGKVLRRSVEEDVQLIQLLEVFNKVGIKWENENEISKAETKYVTGDWFEEYIYPIIQKRLNKSNDEISTGLQLMKGEAPNEYDIMFTHNNSLYVIECKTDIADNEEGKISYLFTNTLYKAATLKKEFGLWVNYYLFALNDFSKLTDDQKKRAKQLDIKLVGLEILTNEKTFEEFIDKM